MVSWVVSWWARALGWVGSFWRHSHEENKLNEGRTKEEIEKGGSTTDAEYSAITASYTAGGMTLAGAMNEVDAMQGTATKDFEGYEFTLSFAF